MPVQPRAQRQCASPDASTRQRPLDGAPQRAGHCALSHCWPDHPAAHTHSPRSQRPCSRQPGSHTASEQSSPRWNGWHTQVPASQRPRPEHLLGHSAAAAARESSCTTPRGRCVGSAALSAGGGGDGASETEQPAPANPGWHAHTPARHLPCPEQWRGHASSSQASPAQPSRQTHKNPSEHSPRPAHERPSASRGHASSLASTTAPGLPIGTAVTVATTRQKKNACIAAYRREALAAGQPVAADTNGAPVWSQRGGVWNPSGARGSKSGSAQVRMLYVGRLHNGTQDQS